MTCDYNIFKEILMQRLKVNVNTRIRETAQGARDFEIISSVSLRTIGEYKMIE